MTDDESIDALWDRYCSLENRADRPTVMSALNAALRHLESAPPDLRSTWVDHFIREWAEAKQAHPIRAPLFRRVLFPELEARYLAGDPTAAIVLAELSQELFRYRDGWAALGYPGEVELWQEAYRRDQTSEKARSMLVKSIAQHIQYTLHELPTGVLFGTNGATIEQCAELLNDLATFRALLTSAETECYRDLLELASFHYPNYRMYLEQDRRIGYPAFLAEQPQREHH